MLSVIYRVEDDTHVSTMGKRGARRVDVQTNKRSASSFRFVHFASFTCSFVLLVVSCSVKWSLYSPMSVVSSQKRLYPVSVYCVSDGGRTLPRLLRVGRVCA